MDSLMISTFRNMQNQAIRQRYNEIYAHERAHKSAAGKYAGNIVIEENSQGIPVGGHVSIQMPALDPNNPDSTIEHANVVMRAAMAPSDPSEQDYRVAASAQKIKNQAEALKRQKHIDFYA